MSLQNLDDHDMPAGMSFHPYFLATPGARIEARVGGMWRTDAEVLPTVHGEVLPSVDPNSGLVIAEAELDTVFTGWDGIARINWPERGATLTLEAEVPLGNLVLYTPAGAGYFCAEPVSNITDAFNLVGPDASITGVFVLAAGETRSTRVRFFFIVTLAR
jgi:aldose 1-epimerase